MNYRTTALALLLTLFACGDGGTLEQDVVMRCDEVLCPTAGWGLDGPGVVACRWDCGAADGVGGVYDVPPTFEVYMEWEQPEGGCYRLVEVEVTKCEQ